MLIAWNLMEGCISDTSVALGIDDLGECPSTVGIIEVADGVDPL